MSQQYPPSPEQYNGWPPLQYPQQSSQPVPFTNYPPQQQYQPLPPQQQQWQGQPSYPPQTLWHGQQPYSQQQPWQPPSQPFLFNQPGMYPPQMQYAPYPYPYPPQQIVNVNIQQKQHGCLMRALYFIFIGSWAGFIWLNLGYLFCMTMIGLPIGLIMLNRLPTVLTLRPASQQVKVSISGSTTNINIGGAQQHNFLVRALYFVCIGWWAGWLWATIGYLLCVLIVTIPVGLLMLDRLPAVITLRKN